LLPAGGVQRGRALFLLVADLLEVVLPYHAPSISLLGFFGRNTEIGGMSLVRVHFFDIAVGCEVVIAALVLLGQRWLALATVVAGSVLSLTVFSQWIDWIPRPLQLLTAAAYLLTAARRPRTWPCSSGRPCWSPAWR
jgi:hypothetical protein